VLVATVNDYLAQRDAEQMGRVHTALGLTVGLVTSKMESHERKEAYAKDITYCTGQVAPRKVPGWPSKI
jgi:preprotein translocase subunit SecA